MTQETGSSHRRDFTRNALQSLTALALIEGLWSSRLIGAAFRPLLDDWFKELNTISKDVHEHKTKDVEFQKALEDLYRRVDLQALLKSLDFDGFSSVVNFPAKGTKSFSGDDVHMSGLPKNPAFGRQIFAMKKGRSVSYPVSTVLRACPPPRLGLSLAGVRLGVTHFHRLGFPVLLRISSADMPSPLPRWDR